MLFPVSIFALFSESGADAARALSHNPEYGKLIANILLAVGFIGLALFFRKRFVKIVCSCGAIAMFHYASKHAFGSHHLLTQILCWITAVAVCILTVSIVNRIHWGNLRGRPGYDDPLPSTGDASAVNADPAVPAASSVDEN